MSASAFSDQESLVRIQRRLSIIFVVPRFHTNLFFAVKALIEAGHQVNLLCATRSAMEDHTLLEPIYMGSKPSLTALRRVLARLSPDLLFIRDVENLSKRVFLAALWQRGRIFAYDQQPFYRARSLRKLVWDLRRGRPLWRITPVLGLDKSRGPDRRSVYLPFPVSSDPDPFEPSHAPNGTIRILCVGKLSQARKNHRLLIEALAGLKGMGKFTLSLVGSSDVDVGGGSADYLKALYAEERSGALAGQLTIVADVAFCDMPAIYREHDICVLPSVGEPLGSAPLEAMAYGCVPVISTGCGSAGYISDAAHGAVVKAGDLDNLRNVLGSLIGDPAQLARIGRNAQRLAATEFGMERFARRVEALFKSPRRMHNRAMS